MRMFDAFFLHRNAGEVPFRFVKNAKAEGVRAVQRAIKCFFVARETNLLATQTRCTPSDRQACIASSLATSPALRWRNFDL